MRAAARARSAERRTRARAHPEAAGDGLEPGEPQRGHVIVVVPPNNHLTHAWPRASSAAGEARRDARGGGRDQPRAGEGARAP